MHKTKKYVMSKEIKPTKKRFSLYSHHIRVGAVGVVAASLATS